MQQRAAAVPSDGTIFGHPKGLFVLFFTEMWERFSYYGMRALLMLYMTNYFLWTQEDASSIYKWYTSLVYLTPLLGGYLADKFLGNKWAIVIGALLMAIGHFLMAFEEITIFYAALVFLILGNGFFKPNMSTQVGRLYPPNDPRRDSAYTIFYMGINLGAFLSPLICGWLAANTVWKYHAGFTAAGIGMVLGLVIYLIGLPWVQEIAAEMKEEGPSDTKKKADDSHYMTEAEAATTPSVIPWLAKPAPGLLYGLGVLCLVASPLLWWVGIPPFNAADNAVALALGGGFASFMGGWITSQVSMAVRDRVLAILVIAVFVVFFWAAFEQAGNAMNVYADKVTDRYVTMDAPPPSIYPAGAAPVKDLDSGESFSSRLSQTFAIASSMWWNSLRPIILGALIVFLIWMFKPRRVPIMPKGVKIGFVSMIVLLALVALVFAPSFDELRSAFNPMPTAWFQSVNPLAIFILAPFFAWLWVYLPRRGINFSIAAKVAFGVFMQGVAFSLMMWATQHENQPSGTALESLPMGVATDDQGRVIFRDAPELMDPPEDVQAFGNTSVRRETAAVVQGGRLEFNDEAGQLNMRGVLADTDRDRLLRATVPQDYLEDVRELALKSAEAAESAGKSESFKAEVQLDRLPESFDLRFTGMTEEQISFDPESGTLSTTTRLADKDYKQVLLAGVDPEFRRALNELYVESAGFKVGPSWLFWFYILCTIGELCLSPVGLSMVSKLAPARFATMLMGMWLLTSFFGNFVAGLMGEKWGAVHPMIYFGLTAAVLAAAAFVCFLLVKKITSMMHGVK